MKQVSISYREVGCNLKYCNSWEIVKCFSSLYVYNSASLHSVNTYLPDQIKFTKLIKSVAKIAAQQRKYSPDPLQAAANALKRAML